MWVSTHPAYKAVSLTINGPIWQIRSYSELQLGHICHHEWGYGKYVMWPPKEQLDNIQFRNKRALVETDQTAPLILYIDSMCIPNRIDWLDFHQSAGFVSDSFAGPALILQAGHVNMYLNMGIKNYFFLFVCCSAISQHSAQVLSSLLSSPVWKRSQRALMPPPHT